MRRDDFDNSKAASKPGFFGSVASFVSTRWSRLSKRPELPEYALHYYDSLSAKFQTLPEPPPTDVAAQKAYKDAKEVVETPRAYLTWADLMLLELSITRSLSFDALRIKLADLRARPECAPPVPDGLTPKLDAAKPEDLERLRAEAEVLATRIWHARMARNARDRYVGELRSTLMMWLVGILAVFVAYSVHISNAGTPLWFVIATAGMVGALISIFRRLQAVLAAPPSPDQSSDLSALAYEKRAAVISLLAGGVFAIILYVAFAAGLSQLSLDLAPQFVAGGVVAETGANFDNLANDLGPAAGKDYAKVVLWSFAAGFFEQLVPDVLDRLVKKK